MWSYLKTLNMVSSLRTSRKGERIIVHIWNSLKKHQTYIVEMENILVVTEVREEVVWVDITIKELTLCFVNRIALYFYCDGVYIKDNSL